MTAEHKVNVRNPNGKTVQKWVPKKSHGDNHYLDAEVYAMAAADLMNVRTLHLQQTGQEELEVETQEPEEQTWLPDISSWLGGIGGNNEPAYE